MNKITFGATVQQQLATIFLNVGQHGKRRAYTHMKMNIKSTPRVGESGKNDLKDTNVVVTPQNSWNDFFLLTSVWHSHRKDLAMRRGCAAASWSDTLAAPLFVIISAVWHNCVTVACGIQIQIHKVQGNRMWTMTDMQNKLEKNEAKSEQRGGEREKLSLIDFLRHRTTSSSVFGKSSALFSSFFVIHKSVSKSCDNFDFFSSCAGECASTNVL